MRALSHQKLRVSTMATPATPIHGVCFNESVQSHSSLEMKSCGAAWTLHIFRQSAFSKIDYETKCERDAFRRRGRNLVPVAVNGEFCHSSQAVIIPFFDCEKICSEWFGAVSFREET
jgi:hypothetical protein